MDIPSKNLPFKVSFKCIYRKRSTDGDPLSDVYEDSGFEELTFDTFSDDDYYTSKIAFKENTNLNISFSSSDVKAKLYFDGAEYTQMAPDRDENNDPYLHPSADEYIIYRNDHNRDPLIPGIYRLYVICFGKKYYASFEVEPKRLEKHQWQLMIKELESEIKGLAMQLSKKKYAIEDGYATYFPTNILHNIAVIQHHYFKIISTLEDVSKKINCRVNKNYSFLQKNLGHEIDETALRYMCQKDNNSAKAFYPVRYTDYDLPENRWLKKSILLLEKLLKDTDEAISNTEEIFLKRNDYYVQNKKEIENALNEITDYKLFIHKLLMCIAMVKQSDWFPLVSDTREIKVPHTVICDTRYRLLYKIMRELKDSETTITLDNQLIYQWKSTDLLYEQWGFIIIEKCLINLGFEALSGWIYDMDRANKQFIIPYLEDHTKIELKHENIKIHLFYNALIPSNNMPTPSHKNNVETIIMLRSKHRKPDCRLDIFINDKYSNSLVIEFKYRAVKSFWNLNSPMEKQPEATRQIYTYYDKSARADDFDSRPVYEVWAVCPSNDAKIYDQDIAIETDEKIRIIPLTPGEPIDSFEQGLKRVLDAILKKER